MAERRELRLVKDSLLHDDDHRPGVELDVPSY